MINTPKSARDRFKPPRGMAAINRAHPVGQKVSACWAFNEGGGGAITELVSGVQCPITLNATEANRPRWRGGTSGLSSLDFRESPVTQCYARGQRLQRTVYSQGITFLGVFQYPTGGSVASNRALIITRTDNFNGLVWTYSTANTLTIATKGWAGWNTNTGLFPPREELTMFAGTHAPNGDIRMWMNGERYSTTYAYSVPTINEWYIGADSYDLSRQWHGQVYLAAVLNGSMTWGEMEAWGRAPFEFLWPLVKRRSSYTAGGGGGGTANNLLLLGVG